MKNLRSEVLPERFKQARTEINAAFKIVDLAAEFGISIPNSGQQICCPFHDDSTPSFSVDFDRNIFKCFGCGIGGSFVEFYQCCQKKFKDRPLNIPSVVDDIIKDSPELQAALGFSTIRDTYEEAYTVFTKENNVDEMLLKLEPPKIVDTICLKHAIDKVSQASTDVKMQFIADCELGMSHTFLIKKYYYGDTDTELPVFQENDEDIQKMFTSLFEDE
ncbi:MAG: CHC2 zinc finger domain-containing protein [Acinetobacter sp.]